MQIELKVSEGRRKGERCKGRGRDVRGGCTHGRWGWEKCAREVDKSNVNHTVHRHLSINSMCSRSYRENKYSFIY